MNEKALFTWSGGKESAFALSEIQRLGKYEITALLTTITADYDRVSMHGIRRVLLEQQAAALGYKLELVEISKTCTNEEYDLKMRENLEKHIAQDIKTVIFGDIFLIEVREYREAKLSQLGMKAVFPLWKKNTYSLAHEFIDMGFKAVITCIDNKTLDETFIARGYDEEFLADLPVNVDPCGENGEFHTFVYDGPIFKKPVEFIKGDVVLRNNRFYFCDLLPQNF